MLIYFFCQGARKVKMFRFLEDAEEWVAMKSREYALDSIDTMILDNDYSKFITAYAIEDKMKVCIKHGVDYQINNSGGINGGSTKLIFKKESVDFLPEEKANDFYFDYFYASYSHFNLKIIECDLVDVLV